MTDAPALGSIDVVTAASDLEGQSAADVLRWASRHLGPKLTFATGFGVEGCVVIDLIARNELAIDVFTLDTGVLFPETYALWRQLEDTYGLTIRAVRPAATLDEQALAHGPALWERDPDRCCDLRKVQPLRAALTGFAGWITAIRRDQTPERTTAKTVEHDRTFGLLKVNPLVAALYQESGNGIDLLECRIDFRIAPLGIRSDIDHIFGFLVRRKPFADFAGLL